MQSNELQSDWIDSYISYMIPEGINPLYSFWTAATILSIVINRNCWLDYGFYNIYPNLYTMLVDLDDSHESAVSIDHAIRIIQDSNISLLLYNQDITIPEIVEYMFGHKVLCQLDNLRFSKSPCLLYQSTLEATKLNISSQRWTFLEFISELYTVSDTFVYYDKLKRQNTIIDHPFLSILLGCTKSFYNETFKRSFVSFKYLRQGMAIVSNYRTDENSPGPVPQITDLHQHRSRLINHLQSISCLYGRLLIQEDARQKLLSIQDNKDPRMNLIRRLTIILALSRSSEGVVRVEDVDRAIVMVTIKEQS